MKPRASAKPSLRRSSPTTKPVSSWETRLGSDPSPTAALRPQAMQQHSPGRSRNLGRSKRRGIPYKYEYIVLNQVLFGTDRTTPVISTNSHRQPFDWSA